MSRATKGVRRTAYALLLLAAATAAQGLWIPAKAALAQVLLDEVAHLEIGLLVNNAGCGYAGRFDLLENVLLAAFRVGGGADKATHFRFNDHIRPLHQMSIAFGTAVPSYQ